MGRGNDRGDQNGDDNRNVAAAPVADVHADAEVRPSSVEGIDTLLDLSPDAVVVIDAGGTVRAANDHAARQFVRPLTELIGSGVEDLLPVSRRALHRRERHDYLAAPQTRAMGAGRDLTARRADASTFPADVALQPVMVDDELLVIAVVRDLTERDRLLDRTRELSADVATLREYLGIASHELRTPLTSVRGFAQTLRSGRVTDETQRLDLLDRIVRNADRQEAIISSLLELARIQSGRIRVESTAVDVATVVSDAVEVMADADVAIRVEVGLEALADTLRLEQVLVNLLTNAMRYGAAPISVEARSSTDGWVEIRVADRGPGVSEAFAGQLFDAFSQHSRGDGRESSGLGLGLYISREIAEAMGGELAYEPGDGGATFVVGLPAPMCA